MVNKFVNNHYCYSHEMCAFDPEDFADLWNYMLETPDLEKKIRSVSSMEWIISTIRYKHKNAVMSQLRCIKRTLQRMSAELPKSATRVALSHTSSSESS